MISFVTRGWVGFLLCGENIFPRFWMVPVILLLLLDAYFVFAESRFYR